MNLKMGFAGATLILQRLAGNAIIIG